MLALAGLCLAGASRLPGQTVIISSDFTGRTISGSTFQNISWTGAAATSSTSSLQALRMDNNGSQVRSIFADVAGYLSVSSNNDSESWLIDVTFTATANVFASSLAIGWASSSGGNASPGFGFALYSGSAPTTNLNSVAFGGGANALGYAISGTVQPSGMGALSSAMTGNVSPIDASSTASPQSFGLTLGSSVALVAGNTYVLRVAVFENNAGYSRDIYLDSVSLSTSAIPEPSSWAAMVGTVALAGAFVLRRRHRLNRS